MRRIVLTFWWTTATYTWLTNYLDAIILLILPWTIKWPIDLEMGGGGECPPVRVFALIKTSARWLARSHVHSTNTCILVVWLCSIGFPSTYVQIYCLQDKWPTNLWEKTHLEETQSMFRKYSWSWRVRGLWLGFVQFIIYQGSSFNKQQRPLFLIFQHLVPFISWKMWHSQIYW